MSDLDTITDSIKAVHTAMCNMQEKAEQEALNDSAWKTHLDKFKDQLSKYPAVLDLINHTFKAGVHSGITSMMKQIPEFVTSVKVEIDKIQGR